MPRPEHAALERPEYSSLRIDELSLQVKLGVSEEERRASQEVRLSLEIRFHEMPAATESDSIADTICYARLCEALRKECTEKEFRLIEHMAATCVAATHKMLEGRGKLALRIRKVKPPIEGLLGGAAFSCGDFPL